MNSPDKDTQPASTLRDEIANLVGKVRVSSSQDRPNEPFAANILDAVLDAAAQTDDYDVVKAVIQQSIQGLEKWQVTLQEMLRHVQELQAIQARQERYGERWWQWKLKTIYEDFQNDPQQGLCEWLRTYTRALLAWELAICEKLANEPFPFPPQTVDVLTLFQRATQAITNQDYQLALDMLVYLTKATLMSQSKYILNKIDRATLLVFIGRIFLYKTLDSEAALNHFEQAKELAADYGQPYSALGEYYKLKNDHDKAFALYQQAIKLSPKQPEGYIGKGLLFEDQKLWDEADDCYKEAIEMVLEEKDIDVALSKLLAPISGNVYLQLARTLKKKRDLEQALQAVTHAISIGIKDEGDYPERLGYRLKGEILEKLQRPTEAAEAYYEAGRQFNWQNAPQIAVELLTQAQKLNPNAVYIYWDLSDALRMCSYQTILPYVDEVFIKKSLAIWEQGYRIEPPNVEHAFAYYGRALINEQRAHLPDADQWALGWEAITYLERAILLDGTDSQFWASLCSFHRLLENESSAFQAISKGIHLDPENLNYTYNLENITVLDELATYLAIIGEFDSAEEVIDTRQKEESSISMDGMKAYVLMGKNSYQEAKELLQRVLETSIDEIWYHELLATCYFMLNEPLYSRKEYEWIWNHYQESDSYNRTIYGWAAYNLNKIDEAIKIFSKMREEPLEIGNTYWNLGLCYLTLGELPLGEENMDRGVALIKNIRLLDDMVREDLNVIEKSSDGWAYRAQLDKILERMKEKIRMRRIQLIQRSSMEEELREITEKYPLDEGTVIWGWIGAEAGLARLYTEEKRWREATAAYLLLQKEGERFSEAHLGLGKIFDELQAEGDACVKEGKPGEALEQFIQISILELLPHDKTRWAQLYSRLGYVYFELGNIDSARSHFAKAIQIYHDSGTSSPGSALGEVCRYLLRDTTDCQALDAEWKAETDDSNTNETLRSELTDARKLLANYLG